MSSAVDDLLAILDLEQLEHNLFRGRSPQVGWQRVFGGQVIGQALVAACRTVDAKARPPHSLHAYFLLAGDPKVPIIYDVDRIRDGKSFATRRVVAIQHGSRHLLHVGLLSRRGARLRPCRDHARRAAVPRSCRATHEIKSKVLPIMPDPVRAYFERERPIELKPVELSRYLSREPQEAKFNVWIRATGRLPDDPAIHQCVLAYASDMTLLDSTLIAHGRTVFERGIQAASLDHALVVPSPLPGRRVAPLRAGQPERVRARAASLAG